MHHVLGGGDQDLLSTYLQDVHKRDATLLPESVGEEEGVHGDTERITDGGQAPEDPLLVHFFSRAVDEGATDLSGHQSSESSGEAKASAGQQQPSGIVVADVVLICLIQSGGVDAEGQDQRIKQDHQTETDEIHWLSGSINICVFCSFQQRCSQRTPARSGRARDTCVGVMQEAFSYFATSLRSAEAKFSSLYRM